MKRNVIVSFCSFFFWVKIIKKTPRPNGGGRHLIYVNIKKAGGKDTMKREQLGQLILASEDSMYHVAKSLLYNDADCQDAIQETIAKHLTRLER